MSNLNIGWYFYKKYFDLPATAFNQNDNAKKLIASKNKELFEKASFYEISRPAPATEHFTLEVAYPGLVTGIGIAHEAGIEGEFKLGLHFDYTTGMPVVYGSSVKGVLNSAFKIEGYIKDCIQGIKKKNEELGERLEQIDVEKLRENIFEGKVDKERSIPVYARDVFFDAVISNPAKKSSGEYFLAVDSITPHRDGPLKNPIPLTFLKIASGVEIEFRFRLQASDINGICCTPEYKLELFKYILMDLGIGAKTNVGYGQFNSL